MVLALTRLVVGHQKQQKKEIIFCFHKGGMERNDQLKLKVMLEKIATLLPGGNGEKCHKLLEAAETFLSGVQKQEEADKKMITKLKEAGLDELLKTGFLFSFFFFSLSDSWQDSKVASAKRTARPPKKADDFFQDDGDDDDDDDEPKKTPSKKSVSVKKAKKLQAVAIEADPAPTEWSCDKVPIFSPLPFLAL